MAADVFLMVEVADTSLSHDHERKLPACGRAGIAEVWIANMESQTIQVYREPQLVGYSSRLVVSPEAKAVPLAFPDAAVDVAELLTQ